MRRARRTPRTYREHDEWSIRAVVQVPVRKRKIDGSHVYGNPAKKEASFDNVKVRLLLLTGGVQQCA